MSSNINKKATKTMEMNKLSISIISVLVTVAISLSSFSWKIGSYSNEISNVKQQQSIIKTDFKRDLEVIIEQKADKVVVELLMKKLDANISDNKEQHKTILEKLDKLIDNQIKGNK